MAYPIASNMTLSVAANSDSADQITPTYQFIGPGILKLIVKGSAIGLNAVVKVGGTPIVDNQKIPYTGTTGTLDQLANVMMEQKVRGGRVEFFLRNTTGGALTADFILLFEPTSK